MVGGSRRQEPGNSEVRGEFTAKQLGTGKREEWRETESQQKQKNREEES